MIGPSYAASSVTGTEDHYLVDFIKKIIMPPFVIKRLAALLMLTLMASMSVTAQERKAYKVVDKDGNVTYSQTPPVDGKEAKKVDIAPAQRGRGGSVDGYSPYDDPRRYSGQTSQPYYSSSGQGQNGLSAQEQRQLVLKAECERQRGTDCNNPAAMQYQDSTSVPRRGRY